MTRRLHWLPLAALVVLAARALAYALAPQTTVVGNELERQAGGPGLVVTAVAALAGATVVASAVLWIATLAVRERHLLTGRVGEAPALRPLRVLGAALGLFVVTSLAFASLESYLHWRAGLGFHGLHCLIGPVHRDALPILGALSLLAAAAEAASRHLLRWMRRTLQALRARPRVRLRPPALRLPPRADVPLRPALAGLDLARGPPAALPA
jgi:hypothetical protein